MVNRAKHRHPRSLLLGKRVTHSALLAGVCVACFQATCRADLSGSDNFNDNSKDLIKWAADTGYGSPDGVLNETNGRLEFTSFGTDPTYQARPWALNFGSFDSNWSVQIDTAIPSNSGPSAGVGFGLEIWDSSSPNLYVGIEHDNFGQAPEYFTYHGTTNNDPLDTSLFTTSVTSGAVRITFDATTKTLSTWCDLTGPSNGYQWQLVNTFGIAGVGGVVNTDWGMTSGDTFTVVPFGYSSGVAAAAGLVYGDNFTTATGTNVTWTGSTNAAWNTTSNWSTSAVPGAVDDVVFASPVPSTGSTLTLANGELANSLTFQNSYTLNGGTVEVTTGRISVAAGSKTTINSVVAGTAGLTLDSGGTLVLGGHNTYAGLTNILGGTLQMGVAGGLPTGLSLSINSPDGFTQGLLDLHGFNQTIFQLTVYAPQVEPSAVAITGAGVLTIKGNVNIVDNSSAPGNGDGVVINAATLDLGGGIRTFNVAGQRVTPTPELAISSVIQNGGVIINATPSSDDGSPSTVELSGNNLYIGPTTINSGILQVDGKLANTTVTVNSTGVLSGIGKIAGSVTVQPGAMLSPGTASAPGTLSVGNLTLTVGSDSIFRLAQPGVFGGGVNDLVAVTGNLSLAGTIDISELTGFSAGTYELFSYTGTLNLGTVGFGGLPPGFSTSNFTLQTSTAHQVNLVVTLPALQFWNGSVTTPNGVVNGGTGTWDNAATNWTNSAGTTVSSWSQFTAVFNTGSGNLTLGDDITANEIRFVSGAGFYAITVGPSNTLRLTNFGITNTSGGPERFIVNTDDSGEAGTIIFNNGASAGGATQLIAMGSTIAGGNSGSIIFNGTASAGSATIINNPGQVSGDSNNFSNGGGTNFNDKATAAQAMIFNEGASVSNAFAGSTHFNNNATAGMASITNYASTVSGGNSGDIEFYDTSTAGNATIDNFGSAVATASGGGTNFFNNSTAGSANIVNAAAQASGAYSGATFFGNNSTAGTAKINNLGSGLDSVGGGFLLFTDNSTAGSATIQNYGGVAVNSYSGLTVFNLNATAGSSNISNIGGNAAQASGGTTNFNNTSTAGNATITNQGGTFAEAYSSATNFFDNATAGNATIDNKAGTVLDADGGIANFNGNSTAGNASITNRGSSLATADGGFVKFLDSSSAGSSKITNEAAKAAGSPLDSTAGGGIEFDNSATAGNATITNAGSPLVFANAGGTEFFAASTAGSATITNNGGTSAGADGGFTNFKDGSDAGNATITSNGGSIGGKGGQVFFYDNSNGGAARIILNGNAVFDISNLVSGSMSIGSIEGAGTYFLGGNTLTIGTNNRSTIVTGVIKDGGDVAGTGGSIIKTGTGVLTLSAANTYTGSTTIEQGKIQLGIANALPVTTSLFLNSTDGVSSGILDLHNFNQTIASLNIVAPAAATTVIVGPGKLTLNGDISLVDAAVNPGLNAPVTIAAAILDLGGAVRTINDAGQRNIADLAITSVIQNGGIIINATDSTSAFPNPGTVQFSGANTYAGTTEIQDGILIAANNGALGAATGIAGNGTIVDAGATLSLGNAVTVGNEALTINGFGAGALAGTYPQGGALNILHQNSGTPTATYSGAITVASNASISANGGILNLKGGIIKNGKTLTFNGNGAGGSINITMLGISGAAVNSDVVIDHVSTTFGVANTYNGTTWITNGGTLNANFLNALPTANGRSPVVLDPASAITGSSANAPSSGSSTLSLGAAQSIASLLGVSTSKVLLNTNTLTIGFGGGLDVNGTADAIFPGVISGTGGVTKDKTSKQILSGVNTYTGATNVNGGTLEVDGSLAAGSTVNVGTAGTLTGSGTINGKGTLTGNGVVNFDSAGKILGTLTVTGGNWNGQGTVNGLVTSGSGLFTINGSLTAPAGVVVTGGSLAGAGTLTGGLNYTSTASSTFGGVIAGSGAVTMNKAGATLILSGTNTYIGATNVMAGTLQLGNGLTGDVTGTSSITVSGTGILATNFFSGSTFARNISLTATGASVKAVQSGTNTLSGLISGSGGFSQSGSGTTILTNNETYTGATNVTAGTLQIDGSLAAASVVNVATGGTLSGAGTINGKATLAGSGVINLASGGKIVGIMTATGGNWNGLGSVGGLVTSSSGAFNVNGSLTAPAGVTVTGGTLGGVGTLTGSLTYTSASSSSFGGILAGSGASVTMNKAGATLMLTGNNTYTGATTVSGGALQIGNGTTGAIPGTSGITVSGTGTLAMNLANGGSLGQNVALTATGAALKAIQSGTTTFSGVISGSGVFNQSGIGTTILSGTETYTGATNVTAGTLQVDGSLALGSTVNIATAGTLTGIGTINGKATLAGNGIIDFDAGGKIVGTLGISGGNWTGVGTVGGLVTSSAGAFNLNGNLTANSGLTVSGGTLAGTGTLNGNLIYTSTASSTFGGIVAGGTVTMNNAASTLTLTGVNTYTGGTTITGGTLSLGNGIAAGASLGSGKVTVNTNATLGLKILGGETFSNQVTNNGHVADSAASGLHTIASVIAGTGNFIKTGGSAAALTAANTYTGGTTVSGGALLVKNSTGSATGTGTVAINSGGTLGGNGTISGGLTLNNGGIIAPSIETSGVAGTTLHATSMMWNAGGVLMLQLGAAGDELVMTGALTKGSAGSYFINLADAGITQSSYTLITFASSTFTAANFTLQLPSGYDGHLTKFSTSLVVDLTPLVPSPSMMVAMHSTLPLAEDGEDPVATTDAAAQPDETINSVSFSMAPETEGSSVTVTPAPEPTGVALLASGSILLLARRRRRCC